MRQAETLWGHLTSGRGLVVVTTLVIAGLATGLVIVDAIGDDPGRRPPGLAAPWANHLVAVDEALAAKDANTARWEFQEAYRAALGSRRWEAMADVGDTAMRLGNPARARIAYLTAASRARAARSSVGVLRAVEGFAALGDAEVAERWIAIARELAGPDPIARARVNALAERVVTQASAGLQL